MMDASSSLTCISKRPRLQCPHCKETLSYSTYCRHQQTKQCVAITGCASNSDSSDLADSYFDDVVDPTESNHEKFVGDVGTSGTDCDTDKQESSGAAAARCKDLDEFTTSMRVMMILPQKYGLPVMKIVTALIVYLKLSMAK